MKEARRARDRNQAMYKVRRAAWKEGAGGWSALRGSLWGGGLFLFLLVRRGGEGAFWPGTTRQARRPAGDFRGDFFSYQFSLRPREPVRGARRFLWLQAGRAS